MIELASAFETLGLEPGTDPATIRRRWVALVRACCPPPGSPRSPEAERRLAAIDAAYETVFRCSDLEMRQLLERRKALRCDAAPLAALPAPAQPAPERRRTSGDTPHSVPVPDRRQAIRRAHELFLSGRAILRPGFRPEQRTVLL